VHAGHILNAAQESNQRPLGSQDLVGLLAGYQTRLEIMFEATCKESFFEGFA
jgi:hypothetical protein